jgi:hypothetical protein
MRKYLFILITLFFIRPILAQDVDPAPDIDTTVVFNYFHDSLTVTIDTADVVFPDLLNIDYHTISIYTISGADTVNVFTQSTDGLIWSQKALTDLSADTSASFIIVSTVPKEYIISDPQPGKIRIISTSNDGSITVFTLSGKRGTY